jgi:hypothetical protein
LRLEDALYLQVYVQVRSINLLDVKLGDDPGGNVFLDFASGIYDQWTGRSEDHMEQGLADGGFCQDAGVIMGQKDLPESIFFQN